MNEVLASIVWIFVGACLVGIIQKRVPRSDQRYLWYCFGAHVASAFILKWLVYNVLGGGDMEVYFFYGDALTEHVRRDGALLSEVVRLFLQQPAELPMDIYSGQGSSTASIIAATCLVMLVSAGSEYGTALCFSLLAMTGQIAMYFAFRNHFPPAYRRRLLLALFLVPSAVFWSSGVVKEALAIAGMGWMIWGVNKWIVRRERTTALVWIGIGGVVVAVQKAYVLFPMSVAAGIWWFWHHSLSTKGSVAIARKPLHMIGAAAVAVFAMIGLGQLFPEYSIQELGEEAADLQERGRHVEGGSNYEIGDPTETSLAGQLAFAPLAIFSSMLRPMIVEAHNAVAAINGLEMLAVKILLGLILYHRGARGSWRLMRSSPALVFCAVFVVLFGLGVGLATTNLGTLSRYRIPMMPMYALILLMLLPMKQQQN